MSVLGGITKHWNTLSMNLRMQSCRHQYSVSSPSIKEETLPMSFQSNTSFPSFVQTIHSFSPRAPCLKSNLTLRTSWVALSCCVNKPPPTRGRLYFFLIIGPRRSIQDDCCVRTNPRGLVTRTYCYPSLVIIVSYFDLTWQRSASVDVNQSTAQVCKPRSPGLFLLRNDESDWLPHQYSKSRRHRGRLPSKSPLSIALSQPY